MIISPIKAIEAGWITHPECKTLDDWKSRNFISPNAIDFDISVVYKPSAVSLPFFVGEDHKQHVTMIAQQLTEHSGPQGTRQYFSIPSHSTRDFASSMHVKLPAGVCAMLIVRSTMNRNGMFITAGLYDQGFEGQAAGMIHNRGQGTAFIEPNTRVGQIVFISADDSSIMYAGGYNTEVGQHWTDAAQQAPVTSSEEVSETTTADSTAAEVVAPVNEVEADTTALNDEPLLEAILEKKKNTTQHESTSDDDTTTED